MSEVKTSYDRYQKAVSTYNLIWSNLPISCDKIVDFIQDARLREAATECGMYGMPDSLELCEPEWLLGAITAYMEGWIACYEEVTS